MFNFYYTIYFKDTVFFSILSCIITAIFSKDFTLVFLISFYSYKANYALLLKNINNTNPTKVPFLILVMLLSNKMNLELNSKLMLVYYLTNTEHYY